MPVYFIQAGGPTGPVKIGYGDAQGRLTDCQVGNHLELRIIRQFEGGLPEEIALHARFDDLWIRGEWHNFSRAMLGDVGLVEILPEPERLTPISVGSPKLADWISTNKITMAEAARRFSVAHTTVARWCSGELFPGRASMVVIRDVTGAKVMPDDFMPARFAAPIAAVQSQPSEAAEPQAAE